ncbi:MAG: NADP oxidoreductase [Candidatus Eisenbacteria bacterium]|nr:NADP oxidoreductase [Candidatus Eisenbacteria bacterium]
MAKPKVATTSLCGCFGCHMSLLDIDERILELVDLVEFDRSPINDIKSIEHPVDIGLVEGGCANEDNVRVLQEFRRQCKVLVSVGDCATNGGLPSLRNLVPLEECLREAYLDGPTVHNDSGRIPDDEEIPLLLSRVKPCHEIVEVDYHLPGCPPSADAFWAAITALLEGHAPELPYLLCKYD